MSYEVSTVEELDALPYLSIVQIGSTPLYARTKVELVDGTAEWRVSGADHMVFADSTEDLALKGPLTVIYRPDAEMVMPGKARNLNRLAAEIHANARAHGFWDGARNFGETVALAHAELSEALEGDRAGNPLVYEVDGKPEGVAVELVDCMIRCLDWLGSQGVDVDAVMAQKMAYNASRPHKHGKAY